MNNNITEKIELLINNHTFDELNREQRDLVLSRMTRSDYTQMKAVLVATGQLNETKPPLPVDLQDQLRQRLRQKTTTPTALGSRIGLAVSMGIMIGALSMAGYHWMTSENNSVDVSQVKQILVADTVYVDKRDTIYPALESEPRIITKEVIRYVHREPQRPSPNILPLPMAQQDHLPLTDQVQSTLQGSYFNNLDFTNVLPVKLGKPIGEEGELMDLLTEMPSDGFE